MNIIDAWKVAKEGQKITCKYATLIKSDRSNLYKELGNTLDDAFLFDDWEVVKEKKSMSGFVKWRRTDFVYPSGISGNLDFISLVGKITKLTIEWEE